MFVFINIHHHKQTTYASLFTHESCILHLDRATVMATIGIGGNEPLNHQKIKDKIQDANYT